nr:quinoprotein dehydrogenase-associated SoxYZ-like carrier [Oceanococcus sp. HetDA_MAG_MS8]
MPMWLLGLSLVVAMGLSGLVAANELVDPLDSPGWRWMQARYFADQTVRFDNRVQVLLPASAEDALQVPVMVQVQELEPTEILVFADLNPITTILRYYPVVAEPRIGFRFKVQQGTPVRAAVRTADGVWHVGGAWLEASGGGCTAPSFGTGGGRWQDRFAEVAARTWERGATQKRLRYRVIHPMDTGLADGIPAFFIERTEFRSAQEGMLLARLETFEPISEDPIFTLDLNTAQAINISGRDTQGNRFHAEVP